MFWMEREKVTRPQIDRPGERGTTALETLAAVTVLGVVTTMAIVGYASARDAVRLRNSAMVLTRYLEKARAAAIRCHCAATITIVDTQNYSVNGTLDSSGNNQTRQIPLDRNITFGGSITFPTTITYNWRGRSDTAIDIILNSPKESTTVNVAGGGDVSIDTPFDASYTPPISGTNLTNDISTDAIAATQKFTGQGSVNGNAANAQNHKKPKK